MAFQEFSPKQYLQIDIANNFGLDKKNWNERLAWFNEHEPVLENMLSQADEPALYFAGVQAWRAVQDGEAIGYPISLDATCSGMQILAAITGDRSAGQLCNVLDFTEEGVAQRRDGYTVIYDYMQNKLGNAGRISRDDAKQAVMTSLYGSQAVPKEVFGTGMVLSTFYRTMMELAPAAWELNETFLKIWDSSRDLYSWVLPDNGHIHVKVIGQVSTRVHFLDEPYDVITKKQMPIEEGRSLGANVTHSLDGMIVREMTRRCSYNPRMIAKIKHIIANIDDTILTEEPKGENANMTEILWGHYMASGYLSARILDYIDEVTIHLVDVNAIQELINSLPAKPFQVISVHDCFRCLPNYGNDLRRQYNRQLYLLAKSNILSFLFTQLMGHDVKIGKLDPTMVDGILESNYALS